MSQPKLLKTMYKHLKSMGYKKIQKTNEYILAEGELPVIVLAHLDTVELHPPTEIYYDQEAQVMWSPDLLGADDRAGVYAILQLLEAGLRPHIIFTTDEEIGGLGAQAVVSANPECPFKNVKAIFQLDRRGSEDCVFYNCDNKDFITFVEKYGFKFAEGSFTDISIIAPAWGIAAANLSIGYMHEHTKGEILYCKILDDIINRVKKILQDSIVMPYFIYKAKPIPAYVPSKICSLCGTHFTNDNPKVKVQAYSGEQFDVCLKCMNQYS